MGCTEHKISEGKKLCSSVINIVNLYFEVKAVFHFCRNIEESNIHFLKGEGQQAFVAQG